MFDFFVHEHPIRLQTMAAGEELLTYNSRRQENRVQNNREQVKPESDQWTEMHDMLEQVRLEMQELQPSRDTWQHRAMASSISLHSLNSQAGARSGCSISASRKCKAPWWKGLFVAAPTDYEERERCEERGMAAFLEAAKEACIKFAKGKCIGPFRDARIASDGLLENTDFDVWGAAADKTTATSSCVLNSQLSFSPVPGVTNYRGSDVLDSSSSKENNSSG